MNFRLTNPCGNCPFRKSVKPYLTKPRAQEISEALLSDQSFTCHKTVRGLSANQRAKTTEHCAGALIMLEKIQKPNQMMRIAERLGAYSPDHLAMDAEVYDSFDAFISAQEDK